MRGLPTVLMPVEAGEALKSYAGRIQAFTTRGRLNLAKACFGTSWAETDWVLPTNLEQFAQRVGARLGRPDTGYWLQGHTLAPFYSRTLSERRCQQLQLRLTRPTPGRRAPFVAFSMEEWFSPSARLCPQCDEYHQAELGFSWIHRSWLLPFVTRCAQHGELLQEFPHWSPRERGPRRERSVLPKRSEAGLVLARCSRDMLEFERPVLDELAALLTSRGYKHRSGKVRRAALVELVSSHAADRCEHPELAWLLGTRSKLTRLLSPLWSDGKVTLHPTVAIHLLDALREQPEIQPQLELDLRERQAEQLRRERVLSNALATARTTTEAARQAGVSVTTAVVAALAAGLSVRRRPKILKESMRKKVEELLVSGKLVSHVAAVTKLSLSTVYRVRRASRQVSDQHAQRLGEVAIGHRQDEWAALMKRHPHLGTTELRRLSPAVYTYLYRHARDWLDNASPAKLRPNAPRELAGRLPTGADVVLAASIRRAGATRNAAKATSTWLLAQGGLRTSSLGKVKAPLASEALGKVAEQDESFVVRRLEAAVAIVLAEGYAATPWRVLKRSGLRSTTVSNTQVKVADVIRSCRANGMRKVANA